MKHQPLLQINNLHVAVGAQDGSAEKVILHGVNLTIAQNQTHVLMGPNGTGKSTFVKMLLGKVEPDGGRFDIGDTVRFGYFSQEGMKFDDQQRVIACGWRRIHSSSRR